MKEKTVVETLEEKKKRAGEFNLTSDLFAGKVFEDMAACQELCRILLQDEAVTLRSVRTQYVLRNLGNHSVELDIFAEEITGSLVNVELQMYEEDAPFKRNRYYMASIDMSVLEKGKSYCELPNVTMIYITKQDFIGGKRGHYQIDRRPDAPDVTISMDNGMHEKYFNLEYPTDDMKIDELLRYIKCSDPFYQTKNFPCIVERVKYFKLQKEGVEIMCEIADRIRKEGKIEGKIESIMELLGELGKVPKRTARQIKQETNLSVLSDWLKCAASSDSIEEFEAKVSDRLKCKTLQN